jgi:hypothetical protein
VMLDLCVRSRKRPGLSVRGRSHPPEDGPPDDVPGLLPANGTTDVYVGDADELAEVRCGFPWSEARDLPALPV